MAVRNLHLEHLEDEIIKSCLLTLDGEIIHPRFEKERQAV